ncbi:GntR family transcriptional regulator [Prauserella flavalba]|uniref:GntR family transcriptional regulator n=1 Tax=Prauserella flavalba TaxID=1477506 RepID=UPI0036F07C73
MLVSPVRHSPLGEQLLDQLRALIVRGELAAGTHLVEGWVAENFGVSRGPVRDALRQLELEGLVETRRRGVFVRGLTDTDLVELYSLRGALEGLAIRTVRANRFTVDWSVVDDVLARMREHAEQGDPARFAAADLDFHSAFFELAGNRRLAATWAMHRPIFAAMLDVTNTRDRDLRPIADDHAELAGTVKDGTERDALAQLTEHLDGSRDRMRASLAELAKRPAS